MRIKIPVNDLELNTIIANDMYNEDFQLVITGGTLLSSKILDRLKIFNVEYVYIDQDDNPKSFIDTKEFIEFKEKYIAVAIRLKDTFLKIAAKNITEDELNDTLNICLELYTSTSSSKTIFDMLYHMRKFSDVTFVHSLNVGMVSAILGKWVGKSEFDEHLLLFCGILHDIGKLVMPSDILNKPDTLTPEEFEIIKTHTTEGYKLLKNLDINEHIKNCALYHHEKINGSGYPEGLKGSQIDDFAKIVTIADIYEALTSERVYRASICPFDVIELFEQEYFQLYDTKYILTFLQNLINNYLHSQVTLSNGSKGEIIMVNTDNLSKPIIHTDGSLIDLSKEEDIKIEKIILH